jgi:acyl carrier protein
MTDTNQQSPNVQQRVLKAISNYAHIEADKLELDTPLQQQGNIDSIDTVEIIMEIEDEFSIEVPDAEAEAMKTPNDLIKYVKTRCPHLV